MNILAVLMAAVLLTVGRCPLMVNPKSSRDLLTEIYRIKAIDNHAHPLKYVAPGEKPDDEFDALPLDVIVPFPLPNTAQPDESGIHPRLA